MTVWRICIACWIPKSTDTHSEFLLFHCNSGLHGCALVICCRYIGCLVCIGSEMTRTELLR